MLPHRRRPMTRDPFPPEHQPPLVVPSVMPSTRDRLLLAFAELGRYCILAREGLPGDAEVTRARLADELATELPDGTGSFVFWTRDDEAAFERFGDLSADLPLHVSGDEVADACRGIFPAFSLRLAPSDRSDVLRVAADAPGDPDPQPEETARRRRFRRSM
jgi:hypothetical protein